MKIAILNDTHCGVRNDMIEMANYQARFYNDVFFPYLDEHDIKHIIHLGDYFDRRKYINFNSLFANRTHFIKPMLERGISMDLVIGNHDTYYKSTNEVNSPELLLFDHDSINVITEAVVKEYDGFPVALVPWINNENYADTIDFLTSAASSICMGHFEIEGALMMPGFNCPSGLSREFLRRFEVVLSGHFHTKSQIENVRYLGSQMQFTWSDHGDEKYFHIYDTETLEILPVHNPLTMFEKVFYDDSDKTFEQIQEMDVSSCDNKFVKLIVVNKENPYLFDMMLDKLSKVNPLHLQVVDDHKHMDTMDDSEFENIEDTLTILTKYIDGLDIQGEKKPLDDLMRSLYTEALDEHSYV